MEIWISWWNLIGRFPCNRKPLTVSCVSCLWWFTFLCLDSEHHENISNGTNAMSSLECFPFGAKFFSGNFYVLQLCSQGKGLSRKARVSLPLCKHHTLLCMVHAAVNIIPDRFCSVLFMSCKNHTPPVSALCSSHPPHVNLTYLTGITALNPASWTPEINMKLIYYQFLLILSALSHPGFLTSLLVPFHLRW